MDVEIKVISEKPVRKEVWNFKCEESQQTFKRLTSRSDEFSSCFKNELQLIKQIENWKRVLNENINSAFKKVRIKSNPKVFIPPEMSKMISLRNNLLIEGGNKREIANLERAIGDIEAEYHRNKIKKYFEKYSEDPEKLI